MAHLRGHNRLVRLTGGQGAADPLVVATGRKRKKSREPGTDQRRNNPDAWRYVRLGRGQSVDVDDLHRWVTRRRQELKRQVRGDANREHAAACDHEQALLQSIQKKLRLARPVLTPEERNLVRARLTRASAERPPRGRGNRSPRATEPTLVSDPGVTSPVQVSLFRLARHYDRLGESGRASQCRVWAHRVQVSSVPPSFPRWLSSALAELNRQKTTASDRGNPTKATRPGRHTSPASAAPIRNTPVRGQPRSTDPACDEGHRPGQ